MIDLVLRRIGGFGNAGGARWNKRPVPRITRPFLKPLADLGNFGRAQAWPVRWHAFIVIVGRQSILQLPTGSKYPGVSFAFRLANQFRWNIQPQVRLAFASIGSVTFGTMLREQGQDLTFEINRSQPATDQRCEQDKMNDVTSRGH